jgi:hypothetical protein
LEAPRVSVTAREEQAQRIARQALDLAAAAPIASVAEIFLAAAPETAAPSVADREDSTDPARAAIPAVARRASALAAASAEAAEGSVVEASAAAAVVGSGAAEAPVEAVAAGNAGASI